MLGGGGRLVVFSRRIGSAAAMKLLEWLILAVGYNSNLEGSLGHKK